MKKLIKLDFNNTTRERKTEDSYSELYSYDKNNGSFEFEILNDTLTTEQVIALFKFTESNKIWKTTGTVEGNKVKVTFDTTLITQNETVICYLYFDEEQRTSDTFRFKFKVKVSEIDKMSRYEVKERFINSTVIVDRLDVVTKDELKEALKNVGGIATEGLLTEVKAEELYAKKTDAVDNTNFELVKNRVLALELKTDKDTVYDDSEVKERLTTLENKEDKDTKYDDTEVKNRLTELENKPVVDTSVFVTEEKLVSKGYLTEHQDLTPYALKSEIPTPYNDTPLNERVAALESRSTTGDSVDTSNLVTKEELKAIIREVGGTESTGSNIDTSNLATKEELAKAVTKEELEVKNYVTEEELNNRGYLTTHQRLDNVVTKEELATKGYVTDVSNLVTKEELESKNYLTTPYNDIPLKERVEVLENKVDKDTIYNDTELRNRVEVLENKPNVDLSNYVTNEQLENKGFIKQHQELSHLATTSDLEVLRNISVSKAELSKKVDTTEFNTFKDNVVTKTELAEKGYLTTHQDLSEYALRTELYNDTNLRTRFDSLDYDVRNSVDSLKKSVGDIEYKIRDYDDKISDLDRIIPYSATKNELNDYVKRTELPAPYDDTDLRNEFNSIVDNELRNKENEFNSKFVLKDDLRTLVSEIVNQLKSENN